MKDLLKKLNVEFAPMADGFFLKFDGGLIMEITPEIADGDHGFEIKWFIYVEKNEQVIGSGLFGDLFVGVKFFLTCVELTS